MIRILTITGGTSARRQARLKRVANWMAASGWHLADYAEDARSAMFERPADSPRLPWKDPTRWLPGPDALKPREWTHTLRADPRLLGVPTVVLLVLVVGLLSLLAPPSFIPGDAAKSGEQALWRVVTASQLNVREAPSATAQQVGVLYRSQRVLIEGKVNGEWVRIAVPTRGYVSSRFLARAGGQDEKKAPSHQPAPAEKPAPSRPRTPAIEAPAVEAPGKMARPINPAANASPPRRETAPAPVSPAPLVQAAPLPAAPLPAAKSPAPRLPPPPAGLPATAPPALPPPALPPPPPLPPPSTQ